MPATATAITALVEDLSLHAGSGTTAGATAGPRPRRVLLADEDAAGLTTLARAVSGPRRELHHTVCGQLALELTLQLHFDVLVLRLDRPGADAVDTTRSVRACRALDQPTIVVISASEDEGVRALALDAGADRVLSHPRTGTAGDLARALRDLLP